jgi:transposase-like protein
MPTTGNLRSLARYLRDENAAREKLEELRWPNGAVCPRCGADKPYKLTPKAGSKAAVRPGVYKCRACRKQFTVTVGTVMERSHIPLSTWLLAFHLMSSSKKGFSAHQMHREFGLDYKSAWFMEHRIREAMKRPPLVGKLAGIVEADETYVGGKPRAYEPRRRGRPGPNSKKVPVLALIQRGGNVRSFPIWRKVTGANLKTVLREHIEKDADFFTDELGVYRRIGREFGSHEFVTHSANEYVRGDVHVNTAESFFALLKRGINGVYHHVGRQHLHRYLSEFDFRYNGRGLSDGERAALAVKGAAGRRLTYRGPVMCAE